jgi:hypothetical protein
MQRAICRCRTEEDPNTCARIRFYKFRRNHPKEP